MMSKIKQLIFLACVLGVCLSSGNSAQATYIEVGDAGSLVPSAQNITAIVTSITGSTGGNDLQDLFGFGWGGGILEASTNGTLGSSRNFDTMLYLFDNLGTYIVGNDDTSGPNGLFGSFITANVPSGDYFIGISGFPNDALNGDLNNLLFGLNTGVLTAWEDEPGGGTGNYVIGFNSSITPPNTDPIPEPATMILLGTGLASLVGMGYRRRKK